MESADIFIAAENGDLKSVQKFIAGGADIDAQDNACHTALMKASGGRQLEVVKYLIEKGASVTICGETGWTALDSALVLGGENLEVVKVLVKNGADLNTGILNFVSRIGYLEAVKVLVENGASREGNLEVVKYLVEAGADITVKAENVATALDLAIEKKFTNKSSFVKINKTK